MERGSARSVASSVLIVTAATLLLSCQRKTSSSDAPTSIDLPAKQRAAAGSIVIDLGTDEVGPFTKQGFFAPEAVGVRRASWSDGPSSRLSFNLQPDGKPYVLSFLAEPYAGIVPVSAKLALNGKQVWGAELKPGWHAYTAWLDAGTVREGENELELTYSKTGRPADVDPKSLDLRELSASFDQIQIQPVADRVRLSFSSHNAYTRGGMGEGWAIDANDRSPGIWTIGKRSDVTIHVWQPQARPFELEITAHCLAGVAEQSVDVDWNGNWIGKLVFTPKRSTQRLQLAAELAQPKNELVLSPQEPRAPAAIDSRSRDTRQLGIRVFKLELFPAA